MEEKEQMSIEADIIKASTSYLLNRKKVFKKIAQVLIFIFVLLFINIGAKYPVNSEPSSAISSSEIYVLEQRMNSLEDEYKKYVKLYEEIYQKSLIQQIEFESEILIPEKFDFKYVEYTYETAKQLGVTPRVAFRLIYKESSFDETASSKAGAKGMMQLMPKTRKKYYEELRVDTMNLDYIQEDIYIGLYYLVDLQEYWRKRGNSEKNLLKLSLAAYNAGPTKVIEYKGVPPYKETTDFVTFIIKSHSNPTFYANILKKNILSDIS